MKLIKLLVAAGIGLVGIAGPIGVASAAEPGQGCVLTYGADDTIVSPGPNDCIVRYATEDAALEAIGVARDSGVFIWFDNGPIVPDGGGFVVRGSNYIPEYFLVNFAL